MKIVFLQTENELSKEFEKISLTNARLIFLLSLYHYLVAFFDS